MLLMLTACVPPVRQFVEPFDGSTAVSGREPLRVHAEDWSWPEGAPLPTEVVTVVDLTDGGFVEGDLSFDVDAAEVHFGPATPWVPGHRYGWAVSPPLGSTRGPILTVPPGLLGEASFVADGPPTLLDATLDGDGLCLLFSEEPPDALGTLTLGDLSLSDPLTSARVLALPDDLGSASVARCLAPDDTGGAVQLGDTVRITADDGSVSAAVVGAEPLDERWKARHRWPTVAP